MNLDSMSMNYLAAIIGAVAYFALGWAWYSPYLFVNPWKRAQGMADDAVGTPNMAAMALTAIGGFVTITVMAALYEWGGGDGAVDGIVVGLIVSVGVIAMEAFKGIAYYSHSWMLYAINTGYAVVGLGVAGAIYGLMA